MMLGLLIGAIAGWFVRARYVGLRRALDNLE